MKAYIENQKYSKHSSIGKLAVAYTEDKHLTERGEFVRLTTVMLKEMTSTSLNLTETILRNTTGSVTVLDNLFLQNLMDTIYDDRKIYLGQFLTNSNLPRTEDVSIKVSVKNRKSVEDEIQAMYKHNDIETVAGITFCLYNILRRF